MEGVGGGGRRVKVDAGRGGWREKGSVRRRGGEGRRVVGVCVGVEDTEVGCL